MRTARAGAVLATVALLAAGCGSSARHGADGEKDQEGFEQAADRTTCVADAEQVSSYPAGFPEDFPFPARTVVYSAQDRGRDGVVATGVTSLPFKQVLAALNGTAQEAGFKITSGETEEHDAEANWAGNGYRGRWAIRESATCDGETVVQVLAARD